MHHRNLFTPAWLSRAVGIYLVLALALSGVGGAAASPPSRPSAAADTVSPATAAQLATAMGVPPGDVLAADLMGSDTAAVGVSDAPLGLWFPTTAEPTFAILATGVVTVAATPNTSASTGSNLGGIDNTAGRDLVRLHLQLAVPASANCLAFDHAFFSEEFPEYVHSNFNDAFVVQLNDSSLLVVGAVITAPHNIALDTHNNIISVNTVFGVFGPTGTTYDGVTPLLRTTAAVTPSTNIDLYFSITDLGDSFYDSAAFIDNFRWLPDNPCQAGTTAGA